MGMRRLVLRKSLVAWIVMSGLCCHAIAQRPASNQLQAALQVISAQADLRNQVGALQNWLRQWQQGRYPSDSTYINGLLELGLAHLYRNDYSAATTVVRQAVHLCRTRRSDIALDQPAKALYRLGMLLSLQNLPALDTLKLAVERGRGIRLADQWVGNAYLYIAYTHYSAGDFQRALNYIEHGEQAAENAHVTSLLVKLLQEKAKTLNELGRYEYARRVAERASLLAKQDVYPAVIARSYQLLGVIAKNQHQYADALQYGRQAFEIARKIQDPTAPNYAVSVGTLYYERQQFNQAIPFFQYGVDNNTNPYAKAYALTMLGQSYSQKKVFSLALTYYQQGLTSMPIGFHRSAITSLPDARAIRQADQKDYLLTLIEDKADAWLDSAKVTSNRQCLHAALKTYQVADQMIDYMRWDHTAEESKIHWRQRTRGMYERAIETCYRLGDTEQAFRFFEKSRAVMLADQLNELGARQQLSPAQTAEEQRLRQVVGEQQTKLAGINPDNSAYSAMRTALLTRQDSLDAFLKQLETSNPSYYRYKYDNTTPALSDLQRYLKTQQASFVTYFEGDSGLYVLGVSGNKATLQRQSVGQYTQTIRQFMPLLAKPDAMNRTVTVARFLTLGNDLYRQMLAPLHLPAGRLIVSPDGSFIPFETLSRSAAQPDYLVKTYAFSYAYSANLLLRKNTKSTQTAGFLTGDFLGVSPVSFAPALGQATLAGSDDALKPIAARFGSPTMLTHGAATRRAFQADVAAYRVIHLFTHATADSTGQEPTLYFADSTLRLSNLGDGALPNAQLVVLAACKTGLGAIQRGEGVFSLARGFSALGVPSVLTTLWSVQNDATYRLTDNFYSYLDQGLPKDVALQRAKQDWLASAPGATQLPNYWAGLILIGDTAPLGRPARWPLVAGATLLILGAGGAGVWWRRRKHRIRPVISSLRPA
jgi:tetratricopeptide (TPR) repeat protein